MFDVSSGDRFLLRIGGRGHFPRLFKINAEIMGGYWAEEGTVPYHGNFGGKV